MLIKILRNQIILVSLFILICSFIIDSPFQKGGINNKMHYVIYLVTGSMSFLYLSSVNNIRLLEKILFAFLLSFFALAASLQITQNILEKIYGYDYELFLSNTVANLIFYFSTNIFLISCTLIIRKFKK